MNEFKEATTLLKQFKGNKYHFGPGILKDALKNGSKLGRSAVLFRSGFDGSDDYVRQIKNSLDQDGVKLIDIFKGAGPNSPVEDVKRMVSSIEKTKPDFVITFGGGSNIDAVKAALVLHAFGENLDDYFGVNLVSDAIRSTGRKLLPHIAIQTIAGSGAHLTKYSNITNMATSQKKLIIDEAVVPDYSVFDYRVTYNTPVGITSDGALDGFTHLVEVLYGSENGPDFEKISNIASTGVELIIKYLPEVIADPGNTIARDALCYGTDLGGYAIMIGGTNGAHLTSFSLVDILSHGRATAIMEPYYTVFFAPAIESSLKILCRIFSKYGYAGDDFERLAGKDLGIFTAKAMISFSKNIGLPTTLGVIKNFNKKHIDRALMAAKEPALSSKLQNMPVKLSSDMIDLYMRKVLESSVSGNLDIIENVL